MLFATIALFLAVQGFAQSPEPLESQMICVLETEPKPLNLEALKDSIGYPHEAKRLWITGKVVIRVKIDEEGVYVLHQIINDPHPILTEAVTDKIQMLRFSPGIQSGKPVKCWVTIPFTFSQSDPVDRQWQEETLFMTLKEAMACPKPEMVRHLNLMASDLDTFPMEILKFKYLTYINLLGNRLQSIPTEIKQLTQLRGIDLTSNELTTLPDELWQMPNLEVVAIGNNKFPDSYKQSIQEPFTFILFPKDEQGKVKW